MIYMLVVSYHYKINAQIKPKTAKPIKLKITLVPCKGLCCFAETKLVLSI